MKISLRTTSNAVILDLHGDWPGSADELVRLRQEMEQALEGQMGPLIYYVHDAKFTKATHLGLLVGVAVKGRGGASVFPPYTIVSPDKPLRDLFSVVDCHISAYATEEEALRDLERDRDWRKGLGSDRSGTMNHVNWLRAITYAVIFYLISAAATMLGSLIAGVFVGLARKQPREVMFVGTIVTVLALAHVVAHFVRTQTTRIRAHVFILWVVATILSVLDTWFFGHGLSIWVLKAIVFGVCAILGLSLGQRTATKVHETNGREDIGQRPV